MSLFVYPLTEDITCNVQQLRAQAKKKVNTEDKGTALTIRDEKTVGCLHVFVFETEYQIEMTLN